MAEENKETAIVDAVAVLLLTVSWQVRASAPDIAASLLTMRKELLEKNKSVILTQLPPAIPVQP